jgi:ubiquinone/menaquinone biosynthesis C-methylase UbiE
MYYDPDAIMKVNGFLSYFVLATEKIHFPFSLRKDLLKELGDLKGKKVLEYGCSVGSLTDKLVDKVGPKGKIVSTDLAMHNVEIVNKRTKNIKHVSAHHHPHLNKFKLDMKLKFDSVISVGMLSYMQNPKRLLSDLSRTLNKGAEVYFIDYDKFFYFMPNIDWVEDNNKLKTLFKKSGMRVEIVRKKSLFWTYLLIKGKKI